MCAIVTIHYSLDLLWTVYTLFSGPFMFSTAVIKMKHGNWRYISRALSGFPSDTDMNIDTAVHRDAHTTIKFLHALLFSHETINNQKQHILQVIHITNECTKVQNPLCMCLALAKIKLAHNLYIVGVNVNFLEQWALTENFATHFPSVPIF